MEGWSMTEAQPGNILTSFSKLLERFTSPFHLILSKSTVFFFFLSKICLRFFYFSFFGRAMPPRYYSNSGSFNLNVLNRISITFISLSLSRSLHKIKGFEGDWYSELDMIWTWCIFRRYRGVLLALSRLCMWADGEKDCEREGDRCHVANGKRSSLLTRKRRFVALGEFALSAKLCWDF